MPSLSIDKFSCIRNAFVKLSDVNIIIGPQGSGKSILVKLIYFFNEIILDFYKYAEDELDINSYKNEVSKKFNYWFPSDAWGSEKFSIYYYAGNFTVRIMRKIRQGSPSDEVVVYFSKWFDDVYSETIKAYNDSLLIKKNESIEEQTISNIMEYSWQVRRKIQRRILFEDRGDIFASQTFIPAGRAFFTSIGRLVAGIENSKNIDPATFKFAQLLASWRDFPSVLRSRGGKSEEMENIRVNVMEKLFGGRVTNRREAEFIEMSDGRKIPFSSLSSGQQELIPIWFFLDILIREDFNIVKIKNKSDYNRYTRQLIYIEEPEAHLFPAAQSNLMDILISSVIGSENSRCLILTTHSPYIMSRLNVYLKAGQISSRKLRRPYELEAIVPRSCWIKQEKINAMCIQNGEIVNIIDPDDGLIDANYLDSISSQIADDFDRLLSFEESL